MRSIKVSINDVALVDVPHRFGEVVSKPQSMDCLAEAVEIVLFWHGRDELHKLILENKFLVRCVKYYIIYAANKAKSVCVVAVMS